VKYGKAVAHLSIELLERYALKELPDADMLRGAACVVGRDARNPGSHRVGPEHLPHDFFGEHLASHLIAANTPAATA